MGDFRVITTAKKIPNDNHIRVTANLNARLERYLEYRYGADYKKQRVISATFNEALNKLLESEGF